MSIIKSKVNGARILKNIAKFSDYGDWINELIQNAYRAGSSKISIALKDGDFTMEDNGHGLHTTEDWSKIIYLAESGWQLEDALEQDPAGMGIFSALARYEAAMTSNGVTYHTDPYSVCQSINIPARPANEDCQGFRITLKGAADVFRTTLISSSITPVTGYIYQQGKLHDKIEWSIVDEGKQLNPACYSAPETWHRKKMDLFIYLRKQINASDRYYHRSIKSDVDNMYEVFDGYSIQLIPSTLKTTKHVRHLGELLVSYHGQLVQDSCNQLETVPNLTLLVSVFGNSPINMVHPHRERIQKDEKFDQFIVWVNERIRAWKATVCRRHNIPDKIYPGVFCCGVVDGKQINPLGILEQEDCEYTAYRAGDIITPSMREAQFYTDLPKAVEVSNVITLENNIERYDTTGVIDKKIPSIFKEGDWESVNVANNQLLCALQNEALAGHIVWTHLTDNNSRYTAAPGFDIPVEPIDEEASNFLSNPELELGAELETIEMSSNTRLDVYEHITLHLRGAGKGDSIRFKAPICIHQCWDWGMHVAYVNKEFKELMRRDPSRAFAEWSDAFLWTYEYNDDQSFDAYHDYYDLHSMQHLFQRPDKEALFKHFVVSLLTKMMPTKTDVLSTRGENIFMKDIAVESGKLTRLNVMVKQGKEGPHTRFFLKDGEIVLEQCNRGGTKTVN